MNLESINPQELSELFSSLSEEDVEQLKSVAASFFSQGEKEKKEEEKRPPNPENEQPDLESMKKIMSILKLLKSDVHDPRCDLLYALRPMLKESRREKVDQAAKMLKLLSVLPKLRELDN